MSNMASDKNVADGSAAVPDRVRWRRAGNFANRQRYQIIAFACATLATITAVLFALSTLVSPKPNTVLVSLYMLPPVEETLGKNAPFNPLSDRLFDLTPLNVEIIQRATSEANVKDTATVLIEAKPVIAKVDPGVDALPDPADQKRETPIEYRLTDWRSAVEGVARSKELIVHVSSFARVEHNQVIFFGRDEHKPSRVSLSDLLAVVGRSSTRKSLIVLDVGWPMVLDNGDSRSRIEQLDRLIRKEFSQSAPHGCQLLLATADPKSIMGIANEPRSLLSKVLSAAVESPESDSNHDGRTSVREVVDWVARFADSSFHGRRLPTLSLIGSGQEFSFQKSAMPKAASQRVYPQSLAGSWQRREQYLRSLETPFKSETAARWWTGLNDLESRWLRGEPLPSIDNEVLKLERKCIKDILSALEHRRAGRSDSLTIAAQRFPLDGSEEATRLAIELVSRNSETFATIDASGRDAITKKLVAEYVAKFLPEDAPLAVSALLQTIEQTTSIDVANWDLICKVRGSLPSLNHFPIAQTIDALVQQGSDYDRIANRLSLALMRDRLGSGADSSVILARSISKAYQDLLNAEKLYASVGMTSDETVLQFTTQAMSAAEAVLIAERNVSRSLRSIETVMLGLSLDDNYGLCRDSYQSCDELITAADGLLDLLERVKDKSTANRTIPAMELAFLRQGAESIERLIARRCVVVEQSYRMSSLNTPPMISALVNLQQRSLIIGTDVSVSATPVVSLASLSVKSDQKSGKSDSRSISESLAALRERITQIKSIAVQPHSDDMLIGRSNNPAVDSDSEIRISGDLRKLTWDNPDASFELSLSPAFSGDLPLKFQFLDPASPAIRIYPQRGELAAGQSQRIEVSLRKQQDDISPVDLTGIWLQSCSQFGESLIALTMDQQPAVPKLNIDFGTYAEVKGRRICIPLWPNNDPQQLNWYLASNDPAIAAVIVTVSSGNGVSVVSQPLELHARSSTLISFPPPMPKKANEPIESLECPLSIVVTDPKTAEMLGHWTVETLVRDPRGLIQPGLAEYKVDDSGKNRLTINLERVLGSNLDTFAKRFTPSIRLELESDQTTPLIGFGNSRLQNTVTPDQSSAVLFSENLRFAEGEPPVQMIPISINGDRGYFELEGRFPRRSGTVKLLWDQQPRLRIRAGNATAPGTALQTTIESRNLDDQDELVVEVFGGSDDHGAALWQSVLATSRQIVCDFESAGPNATFAVSALQRDWNLAIPSDFGTGEYGVRVSTIHNIGKPKAFAEHRFMIDDGVPSNLQSRADVSPDRTVLNIACEPSMSGNVSLSVSPVAVTAAEKVKPLVALPLDSAGSRWQLNWPAAIPLPEQVELVFVTGAGKEFASTCDLRVQRIVPVGKIVGQVMEGSIAQPQLTVTLRSMAGVELAKYMTDDRGHFEFSVSPGQYQLVTEKAATRRQAAMPVSVGQDEVRRVDLILQRTPPSGV